MTEEESLKKTFIHTFQNGNQVTLLMDYTGEKPIVKATWKRAVACEWPEIEAEYIQWRNICFNEFVDGQPLANVLKIVRLNENE